MNFKERLIQERSDLDDKLNKLLSFLMSETFEELSPIEQTLLEVQAYVMKAYSKVLAERIAIINAKNPE